MSEAAEGAPVGRLGESLRAARMRAGLSLREVARQLSVSPSFISQMENGKSQPSVATLYSLANLLDVSIDALFTAAIGAPAAVPAAAPDVPDEILRRSDYASPADMWGGEDAAMRLRIVQPANRRRIVMDTGVVWEQLAPSASRELDFMEITYPPGASSTTDSRMLRHDGIEYGYLLEGELEITHAFNTFILRAGESVCLDPAEPHLLTNRGAVPARGVWVVHHAAPHPSD